MRLIVGVLAALLFVPQAHASRIDDGLAVAQRVWNSECVNRAVVQWSNPVDARTRNAWGWTDSQACQYDARPVIYLNRREHGPRPFYQLVCHTILHEAGHLALGTNAHRSYGIMRPYMPIVWVVREDDRPKPVGFDPRCARR